MDDQLAQDVPVPEGFEYLFTIFIRLRGSEGVSFQDIAAYETVAGYKLTPVEISAILSMDQAASSVIGEIMKEK